MPLNSSETSCPFCNGVNKCMAESESPCWCFELQIPDALIALLPIGFINKSCVCRACINDFKENENLFKEKYSLKTDLQTKYT